MRADFWHKKWQTNEIGFHQADTNPHLRKHWPDLTVAKGSQILVPLCGKSLDMLWLRDQGYEVLGVELSPLAVETFIKENNLEATVTDEEHFKRYQMEGITILLGDIFNLSNEEMASCTAVFDRASLVALPPEMREAYAGLMKGGLTPQCKILLVSMDYEQSEMEGPPFAVTTDEIVALYGDSYYVQEQEAFDILEANPRFRERGLSRMKEHVYYLHRK
jgi:thiopurine S-methyltransferase